MSEPPSIPSKETTRPVNVYLDHAQLTPGQVTELDLLDGDSLSSSPVESLIDGPKGSLADTVSKALSERTMSAMSQVLRRRKKARKKKGQAKPLTAGGVTDVVFQTGVLHGSRPVAAVACVLLGCTGHLGSDNLAVGVVVSPLGGAAGRHAGRPLALALWQSDAVLGRGGRQRRGGGGDAPGAMRGRDVSSRGRASHNRKLGSEKLGIRV